MNAARYGLGHGETLRIGIGNVPEGSYLGPLRIVAFTIGHAQVHAHGTEDGLAVAVGTRDNPQLIHGIRQRQLEVRGFGHQGFLWLEGRVARLVRGGLAIDEHIELGAAYGRTVGAELCAIGEEGTLVGEEGGSSGCCSLGNGRTGGIEESKGVGSGRHEAPCIGIVGCIGRRTHRDETTYGETIIERSRCEVEAVGRAQCDRVLATSLAMNTAPSL